MMEEKHSTENGGRAESRNGGRRVTAFYIEALILVALLTMVVLVLTWILPYIYELFVMIQDLFSL